MSGATTVWPRRSSSPRTPSQHHPSCHAPWTSPNATICLPIPLEAAVGHEVVEAARAELRAARDPLADEAGLLETSLLRNVLHVGLGLHAVEARLREQPLRQLALRVGAESVPPGLGTQLDPDVPRV